MAAEPEPHPEPAPPWGAAPRSAELELEAREEVIAAPFSPRSIGEEVERETIEEPFDEVYEAGSALTALPRPLPAPPPPVVFPVAPVAAPVAAAPEPEPGPELVAAPEAVPAPVKAVAPPVPPSATLGELFLAQGHLDEAEREFRAVLAVRPADPTARAGLEQVARRRPAPAPPEPAPAAPVRATGPGLTRRKVETLRGYLERLRRASGGSRVS